MQERRPPDTYWTNQNLVLYHGTSERFAFEIWDGIGFAKLRAKTDFGKGFYTTTWREQAERWSRIRFNASGENAAVVQFEVSRDELSQLRILSFVRGQRDAEDFWSLVQSCRYSGAHHDVPVHTWYDVVNGPVAALPAYDRIMLPAHDQFSFHTEAATALLDRGKQRIINVD